ncbi:MAG: SPOR domain-containing protein [Rhodospirillales bacterium]|nr:SPOR domain-containing protein [Rhodospirillales bacterium]
MSGGEDGPETPSAPEPPGSETPPPPEPVAEEGAEPAGDEKAESRRPRLLPVWILLGAAALSGGAWAVMEMRGDGPPLDEASVPLITASAEPWKVRPADPGGLEIPNQGTLIYETLTTSDPEEAPERILPPPEEPMSPPQPETDRAEELAVAASGGEREVATLQPESGGVEEPAPATVEQAAPPESETPEPDAAEEARPTDIEAPTEPDPIEEALLPELDAPWPDSVPRPHPPKPGTLAATRVDVAPLPELDDPASANETPSPAADVPASAENVPELEPETLALLDELLERDSEAASAPGRQQYVGSVPLPIFKPVRAARAAPPTEPVEETVVTAPEPVQSGSRTWRYVQLGAANTRSPLEGHWEMLRRRHGDVLVGLSPLIMPVDSGDSGITYRLRAGPLSDAGAAQRVCAQLKERGLACFVPRD